MIPAFINGCSKQRVVDKLAGLIQFFFVILSDSEESSSPDNYTPFYEVEDSSLSLRMTNGYIIIRQETY
jgi:hypothetical protein